ncbi:MAG: RagB/SusD family nutrient uptake outer membrane protein [Candidatus Pedobacter colombiensis]|uniref:RagB/SusD family nutrient uptake outer membrane protein n=1 Tax=Candidatus Pedobacter colombiensis TaxID=3121371 RepID=A0AAJ5W3N2_9SPHI|nr:RagB/SusD family nutrient uptake outer membrane protein [Pedobacter sp.]WEK17918.1 MAG: RagB/SusD family nutrient uptake outer membrane protein [Pedobacter sp.]
MKNNIPYFLLIAFFMATVAFCSCNKGKDWLDIKSNKGSVIPESTNDFQALLDDAYKLNYTYSTAGLAGADNSSIPDASFSPVPEAERNLYTWNRTIWVAGNSTDWNNFFAIIENANIVLDGLKKINDNEPNYNSVKGQALFHRAFAYYNLAQLFCKQYDNSSAVSDLGLPIRLSSDVNEIVQRSTLKALYEQMISDASAATNLLPPTQTYLQRPINAAAFALAAKLYLHTGDYTKAANYAGDAIAIHPELLDYNNSSVINMGTTYRFPVYGKNNPEILFFASSNKYRSVNVSSTSPGIVVPELYQSYNSNDLRKTIFYVLSGTNAKYRGTYSGNAYNFCGLATNELYLIRAECFARLNNKDAALSDLNRLLVNRYKTGTFTAVTAADATAALALVLTERRKELPFVANIRWEDLRRLNKEIAFQKTLIRTVNGTNYTLLPNDKLYVLPIPDNEIQLTGLIQNER